MPPTSVQTQVATLTQRSEQLKRAFVPRERSAFGQWCGDRNSPNGETVTALPNGTEVSFLGVKGSWSQVQMNDGYSGYVASK
ncbi:MAG: SH3 domain-containing protein [Cyanobacteria bacterium J06649_5]